jgi:type IV pilus assembly protein PilA
MLARIRKSAEEKDQGFTLIELLVVIIIIGILAAIAIPVFLNQRQKGYKADMKSVAKNGATAVESAATETNGDYSTITKALAEAEGFHWDVAVQGVEVATSSDEYCISVADNRYTDGWFVYRSDTGVPSEVTAAPTLAGGLTCAVPTAP